ncbi:site-specific integrase [Sphingobium sufflavum]|uniref:site-specific integrase n=1 Tax=Sphingobium sufflavum TaxID=1129547 RepID=UPI001F27357B|nr:site-specific integrase [Sphingobium sufflavum]MCE7796542.1 site-specific integrase [Sphingobium sufflavum]
MTPFRLGKLKRKRTDGSDYWSFCVTWHTPTGRVRHTLNTQDRFTAEAKARKLYENRDKGVAKAALVATVGECVEAYIDSLGGLRDEKRKRECWKAARGFWSAIPVEVVDADLSHSYMKWRNRATNTMRNELSLIRTALHWKYDKLAPKVIVPGVPDSEVGGVTKDEFRQFLTGCLMPHVKLFCILAVTTGARKTALLEAKWDQVDWSRAQLRLNAEGRTQSHKRRATVPLNNLAMEALKEARAGAVTDYIVEFRGGPLKDIKKA